MDSMSDTDHAAKHHISAKEVRQHAGPWLIAVGVAIKSFLALATAIGLELWGAERMHDWIGMQIVRHHLNPDRPLFANLMQYTSHGTVHAVVAFLIGYAGLHGAEAWGLWRDKPWASWLGCAIVVSYLPFEGFAMWEHPGWIPAIVIVVNVIVVLVLAWNIRRLGRRLPANAN